MEIVPFFDPPHLMKGVRNNLLNKDLEIEVAKKLNERKFASWKYLEIAYNIDTRRNVYNRI